MIFIYVILSSPNKVSVITTLTSLIFLFSILGGFYKKIKSIKTPFGGAELTQEEIKKAETKKELEANTLKLMKEIYPTFPEEFPFKPEEGIIDAITLKTQDLKKLQEYKKILEDIKND